MRPGRALRARRDVERLIAGGLTGTRTAGALVLSILVTAALLPFLCRSDSYAPVFIVAALSATRVALVSPFVH
jgi:hypothetical protein